MESKLIVGIPAFNEERTIQSMVKESAPFASMVVVVDDGSSDHTTDLALQSGAIVLRHPRNAGKGQAVATLLDYAAKEHADFLILLDGDGQHDPAEIPLLLSRVKQGDADIVVGTRFHPGATNGTPLVRRLGQHAFNTMTYLASGTRCSDSQSGFRAFNRRAICGMRLSQRSFSVESEMQFECRKRSLSLAEVPISCKYDSPPKRNIVAHGSIVLVGLVSMAIGRRKLRSNSTFGAGDSPKVILHSQGRPEGRVLAHLPANLAGD